MRTRLLIICSLFAVWVPLTVLVTTGRLDRSELADVAAALEDPALHWSREDLYYFSATRARTPTVQRNQVAPRVYTNQDRIRVLLLGDSYAFGLGLRDPDRRLGERLEAELDARTAPGTFEVVTVARPDRSTYTHAAWSVAIQNQDFIDTELHPVDTRLTIPFDALVLGFVENDTVPTTADVSVPAALRARAPADAPTAYVDVDEYEVTYNGAKNPNMALFAPAAEIIAETVAPGPAVFAPLAINDAARELMDTIEPVFATAGFTIVDDRRAADLRARFTGLQLMVTGIDPHPNAALHAAYAADTADALVAALDPARVRAATAGASAPARPLVSNHLPIGLVHDGNDATATLTASATAVPPSPCEEYGVNSNYLVCDPDGTARALLKAPPTGNGGTGAGFSTAPQWVPCLPLGRPFAQVMFDSTLPDGVSIELVTATGDPHLALFLIGYDDAGFERLFPDGVLKPGTAHRVSLGTRAVRDEPVEIRGVALVRTNGPSCDVADATALVLPAFTLTVTRRG